MVSPLSNLLTQPNYQSTRCLWACVVSCAILLGISAARSSGIETTSPIAKASSGQLKREGSQLIDVFGYFRMTGDRATFYPLESQAGYAGLENLNLDRVTLMITNNTDQLTWQVSGTITEYHGLNYILVSKAILKHQGETNDVASPHPSARSRHTTDKDLRP